MRIAILLTTLCFGSVHADDIAIPLNARTVWSGQERFELMSSTATGVDVVNRLDWNHRLGFLNFTGYSGGGVAVGDVDGNGLPDLFFANGPDQNRLFVNRGEFKFVDTSTAAGLVAEEDMDCGGDGWATGAVMLDIENDGDLDIYVSNYGTPNKLLVNDGNGNFQNLAREYGLDLVGPFLMPTVADFDRDGDLDIYLIANRILDEVVIPKLQFSYRSGGMEWLHPRAREIFTVVRHDDRPEKLPIWMGAADRLLRNEGANKKFRDLTNSLGRVRGDGLSATWWDYNHDGWPDLYVCNDLASEDKLYRNNGDGAFRNELANSIPHTPWFAMGSSAGDINNDGLVDFIAADMSFRTHFKDKAYMGDMSEKFKEVDFFPSTQLMRNALYLNTGTPRFQEAAYLAGIASTNWTWSATLADMDNDGWLDAFFTNGTPANPQAPSPIRDGTISTAGIKAQYRDFPGMKESNLAFRNLNAAKLRFQDISSEWGLDHEGMSYAAVHADLDRDGDLDLVVTNLNEPVSVYRNHSNGNAIEIQLQGTVSNRFGIGSEVRLETSAGEQVRQVFPVTGFKGGNEALVHFGMGQDEFVRSIQVDWPSGHRQIIRSDGGIRANQLLKIVEPSKDQNNQQAFKAESTPAMYGPVPQVALLRHHEEPFDDFAMQPLLPNKLSQLGPGMAWSDIDNDGDEDLFLGNGAGWMGMVYRNDSQLAAGDLSGELKLTPTIQLALADHADSEDMAAVFFDADADGDDDLFVASGGVEGGLDSENDRAKQDRLYLNNGLGEFHDATRRWLPLVRNSSSAVAAADYDRDGDVDLFVGSRCLPGQYPLAPIHQLLKNTGARFNDVMHSAGTLASAGMITAAVWSDVNGDGWVDLLVTCDWGPIRVFRNMRGRLEEVTDQAGLGNRTGWWKSITPCDFDADGDMDFVVGNVGRNTKYHASNEQPLFIYYGEFGDGDPHILEAEYEDETLFPMRGKSCSSRAMPFLTEKFKTYEQFAAASLAEIYTPKCLGQAQKFEVNTLESGCLINDGLGKFEFVPLPDEAQLAPVFGIVAGHFDDDEHVDLFLAQNFFTPQRETGPMDGAVSLLLLGNGDSSFRPLRPDRSGIVVPGDAKSATLADLDQDGREELLVATNNGRVHAFQRQSSNSERRVVIRLQGPPGNRNGIGARVQLEGTKQKPVFDVIAGGGYLSQSSSAIHLVIPSGLADPSIQVRWPDGRMTTETLSVDASTIVLKHPNAEQDTKTVNPSRDLDRNAWLQANLELAQEFIANNELDQAARILRRMLVTAPENAAAHLTYANTLRRQKRLAEAGDEVKWLFRMGGGQSPEVLVTAGRVLHDLQRYDEAMRQFDLAVQIAPDRSDIKAIAVDTLLAQGRMREAAATLRSLPQDDLLVAEKRATLEQRNAQARELTVRGRKLMKTDRLAAMDEYRKVLELNESALEANNNLAWHYATYPDPQQRDGWQAVRLAERMIASTNRQRYELYDTLAAAYAEQGEFGKAIAVCEELLNAEDAKGSEKELARKRLDSFRNEEPVRESL